MFLYNKEIGEAECKFSKMCSANFHHLAIV